MSNKLDSQSRKVCIVIRKNKDRDINVVKNKIKEFCDSEFYKYAYIMHEKHVNEFGEVETTHFHIVGEYNTNKTRLSTRLRTIVQYFGFDNENGIQIEVLKSWVNSVQYLIHKNQPLKTQETSDKIVCNYDRKDLELELNATCDIVMTTDTLIAIVEGSNNIIEIIRELGLETYRRYRNVIWDIWNVLNHK